MLLKLFFLAALATVTAERPKVKDHTGQLLARMR